MDNFGSQNRWKLSESLASINWTKVLETLLNMVYTAVWVACLVWFWRGGREDASRYSVVVFYICIPIVTFLISFFFGIGKSVNVFRWLMVLFFAVMFLLLRYATFDLANMLSIKAMVLPDWKQLLPGGIVALIGTVCGSAIRWIMKINDRQRDEGEEA